MSCFHSLLGKALTTTALIVLAASPAVGAPVQQDESPALQTPAPTMTGYQPPQRSKQITDDPDPRPMLVAMRAVGNSLRDTWTRRATQELGSETVASQFERFYPKDLVAQLTTDFQEGYVQVFVEVPEMMQMTAVKMDSAQSAADFHRINMETLQSQLDQTNQAEDSYVDVLSEGEIQVSGLDAAVEKRYNLVIGDLPPSRFYFLFGVRGQHMFTITFLQIEIEEAAARKVLEDLAAAVSGAGEDGTPGR